MMSLWNKLSILMLLTTLLVEYTLEHQGKITEERYTGSSQPAENPQDHRFFLKQIFNKYGHQGIISYEGFEHLLENLGLGRLVFDKSHNLSLHIQNGSFKEVHDSLHLHQHTHEQVTERNIRRVRQVNEKQEYDELISSYTKPLPSVVLWANKCLSPQDILTTFGLEPHHNLVISPTVFLNLCPAIVYELDQRSCYTEVENSSRHATVAQYSAWLYAAICVLAISLIGLLGVAMVPLVQKAFYQQLLQFLVALAVGTMCGDALLHLLPHALTSCSHSGKDDHLLPVLRSTVTFFAIGIFFTLEGVLHHINAKSTSASSTSQRTPSTSKEQRPLNDKESLGIVLELSNEKHHGKHQHRTQNTKTIGSVAWMVIMGDGLHNLTDGMAIGAAFSGDVVAGFATAVAVLCHELPHELGDFAILLQAGMSIQKAIVYNVVSSVLSFIGMAMGVWLGEYEAASHWVYAFTAGIFLYISLVDLIPHMNTNSKSSQGLLEFVSQFFGISTGAGIMFIIALYEEDLNSLFN